MRLAPITPVSPAQAFIDSASWLLTDASVVTALNVVDDTTVRISVSDPFVQQPRDRVYADRLAADSAMTVLEQALHGVRLIAVTRDGYEGRQRPLAPAQLTFLNGIPGVDRIDLRPIGADVPRDRFEYRIEVNDPSMVAPLAWLLRDTFDVGTVQRAPVTIVAPKDRFLHAGSVPVVSA